jgi:two-component system, OmpR family, alkaline phosphatase synthesis response regulator PhoP
MATVLVVEDEIDIAELIRYNLERRGDKAIVAHSGEEGLPLVQTHQPDIVVLDVMLPGRTGLEVCAAIRQDPAAQKTPIIIVSAKGEEGDVVRGLELGADDYVTKPFSPKVLLARIDAVLRRKTEPRAPQDAIVKRKSLRLDPGRVEVTVEGQPIDLTQSEFRILLFLAQRPGWVYTRGQIVRAVHGENYSVTDRTIDFQMVGLRKKLGSMGEYIETVRGVGYRFKDDDVP